MCLMINDRIFAQVLSCAHLCAFYMPRCAYTPKLMHIIYIIYVHMRCENVWIFNTVIKILTITHLNFILLDNEEIYSPFLQ